ncbi:hypothetical protein BDW62DRAFT_217605 [Aspergillus aurantiobrunneus]
MHVAFLSNPASGQVNVQLATAQQLVSQGHAVTFLSAESCSSKIGRFRKAQQPCRRGLIRFISLGSGHTINDFTPFIQTRIHAMRTVPGNPVSLDTCVEAALCPAEEHAAMAARVRDHLNALDPNMICVDGLTSVLLTGTRLTKRKFILTIPCSPGFTALRDAFEPHPVAAHRDGSWGTFFENIYLSVHGFIHSRRHPHRRAKHDLIKRLGLKSYGPESDSALVQPHWEDDNCVAGIHFNTPGLIDCPKQSSKIVFVGAGVSPESLPSTPLPAAIGPPTPTNNPLSELAWMDEAAVLHQDVVYVNMGSMFVWQSDEFRACIAGFKAAYKKLAGRVRFLFKINSHPPPTPSLKETNPDFEEEEGIPPYVRLTHWIENQHAIYSHSALKAFIHHGGGNSFNEAVHFAIPQLVLSQWLDTHEYATYADKFGLGLRSAKPPCIDAADIERKILMLLGPRWLSYKANCRAWALRSEMAGGAVAAARIVLFHAEVGGEGAGGDGAGKGVSTELTPPLSPVVVAPVFAEKEEAFRDIVIS